MDDTEPLCFNEVFEQELEELAAIRKLRSSPAGPNGVADPDRRDKADRNNLLGLALSGGGIRSASFNLGVLQALAELKLLRSFDYLSTVSGGGYIGSWLIAWTKRNGDFRDVETKLTPGDDAGLKGAEPKPIDWLREYSNYLTPEKGLFSADTWTAVSIWFRNTLLNLIMLCSALSALLLLPRLATPFAGAESGWKSLGLALGLLLLAVFLIGISLRAFDDTGERHTQGLSQVAIQAFVVGPIFVSAWFSTSWWAHYLRQSPTPEMLRTAYIGFSFAVFLLLVFSQVLGRFWQCFDPERIYRSETQVRRGKAVGILLFASGAPAAVAGLLLKGSNRVFGWWNGQEDPHLYVATGGTPLFIILLSLTLILHLGLFGRNFPDERREWWSRLGAWLSIYLLAWTGMFAIALHSPWAIQWIGKKWGPTLSTAILGWIGTTIAGILAGTSRYTGKATETDGKESSSRLALLAKMAPPIFLLGLLVALSVGIHFLVVTKSLIHPGPLFLISLAMAVIIAYRVNVNEFSLHHFYKNRLVRCYLGASREEEKDEFGRRKERKYNLFTGFDIGDDLPLASLTTKHERPYTGPYPILNTTLNLVRGERLGWQERKGSSFVFTPLYCGYEETRLGKDEPGYRPTEEYGKKGGLHLGSPMAISGAAVSPNWGYHTSTAVAFLLTVFNARLGWWLGNPRKKRWTKPGPRMGLPYLLTELFGMASAERDYVYLSDGGHFDNMGIYELVRRQSRFIVLSDSEEDPGYTFGGLGNAIRKCRTDFGAEINIRLEGLQPRKEKFSSSHCALGDIHYKDESRGTLVYLKSSLTGDEPADVLEYAASQAEFPHQSTADQFFDESQFESYRKLGYHVAKTTFATVAQEKEISHDREIFFVQLRELWYPPSASTRNSFSRHGKKVDELFDRLRRSHSLDFLNAQLYPEWESLSKKTDPKPTFQFWLPKDYRQLREGFYFCNSLIQFMEDVYLELNLEQERENPDNRGWMNLFRHWAWSGMFRATWAVCSGTYGARFETFCRRYLKLERGTVRIGNSIAENYRADENLTFLEKQRIEDAVNSTKLHNFTIWPIEVEVNDPRDQKAKLGFPVGFALTFKGELVYFRVQNHLRKMGLGREALILLITEGRVNKVYQLPDLSDPNIERLWPHDQMSRFKALFRSAERIVEARRSPAQSLSSPK